MPDPEFEELLTSYRERREDGGQELLAALLREIQERYGYLSQQAQRAAAEAMGATPAMVAALIKRIPGLKDAPARYTITVCTGPRCAAKDSIQILLAFERALGIEPGGTTPDGLFHLATRNCFKRCKSGPNVRVNETFYSPFGAGRVAGLLEELRGRA